MSLTLNEFITRLQALIVEAGSTPASPPVAPPVGPVNPPSVPSGPPAPTLPIGFSKGTQYHGDFRFKGAYPEQALCNAQKNFNWLMDYYGSSWAYAYMYRSAVLSNYFIWEWEAQYGERNTALFIINIWGGAGRLTGVFIPNASSVSIVGQVFKNIFPSPGMTIVLPFYDNLLYS
jgi:hypothetical protein